MSNQNIKNIQKENNSCHLQKAQKITISTRDI